MIPYRVLLVGLGKIGYEYDVGLPCEKYVMTHARSIHLHPSLRLVGAVDPSYQARSRFAQDYKVPTFANLVDAFVVGTIDVLIIAAPTQYHFGLLTQALALWSPKAILCEKPFTGNLLDAEKILSICEARGIGLYVNYMRCVEPGACEVGRNIRQRIWAPPYTATVWYSKGMRHNGSHFWTLAERWFGPVLDMRLVSREGEFGDGDASVTVVAVHAESTVHYLPIPGGGFSHHAMEILAENGRLRYDKDGRVITWESREPGQAPTKLGSVVTKISSDFDRFQWHVADAVVAALEGRSNMLCTGEEALASLTRLSPLLEF